jgi:7-cyano-7-deazaguanine synthase in queuosine biosynthesis
MKAPKLPLIVWSGGMDSTAVMIHYFSHKIPHHTCYIKLNQNTQTKFELMARNRILKELTKQYGNYNLADHILNPFSKNIINNNCCLILAKAWIDGILLSLDVSPYNKIVFGYIKGDDFWHYGHVIKELYEVNKKLMYSDNIPELDYPMEWYNKQEIYDNYYKPDNLSKYYNMIWTCDNPNNIINRHYSVSRCGECKKCREQDNIKKNSGIMEKDSCMIES